MAPIALSPSNKSEDADKYVQNTDRHNGLASTLERYPENGISVLIVGAGIGGMMTALECWRKGFSVSIVERSTGPIYTGELTTVKS